MILKVLNLIYDFRVTIQFSIFYTLSTDGCTIFSLVLDPWIFFSSFQFLFQKRSTWCSKSYNVNYLFAVYYTKALLSHLNLWTI